jgi:hypothetical protein
MQVSNSMNVKGILELMSVVSPKGNLLQFSEHVLIKPTRTERLKPWVGSSTGNDFISVALLTSDPYDYLSGELSEMLYND